VGDGCANARREEVIIPPGAAAGALYSAPSLLIWFWFRV
jgi:hypothetical protein